MSSDDAINAMARKAAEELTFARPSALRKETAAIIARHYRDLTEKSAHDIQQALVPVRELVLAARGTVGGEDVVGMGICSDTICPMCRNKRALRAALVPFEDVK